MSGVRLGHNWHGKGRVRLVKVIRHGDVHDVLEYNCQVLLEGDNQVVFLTGDNSRVVPTDTVKNTVYCLARENEFSSPEQFGIIITRHFLSTYPTLVNKVHVTIHTERWQRVQNADSRGVTRPHNHTFTKVGPIRNYAWVTSDQSNNLVVESGIKGLDVLKTTQSAFRNFHKDRYTSLVEVDDRLVGTSVDARWGYTPEFVRGNPRFDAVSASVENILVDVFAGPADTGIFSESVQATCYDMGAKVLKVHAGIDKINLYLPNIHNIAFPLEKYGIENKDHTGNPDVFYPIDEPHGMISATIERTGGRSRL